jgi:hypothetical protein
MGVSGLRKEAARGNLMIERIAGKDYTTLAAIESMRELCRNTTKVPASGRNRPSKERTGERERASGSYETDRLSEAQASALRTAERLRQRQSKPPPTTSPKSTGPRESEAVVPLRSR